MKKRKENILVVGIGRVGLPLALVLADEGYNVVGADLDSQKLELILEGKIPFIEEGAQLLLTKHLGKSFTVTNENNLTDILLQSDIVVLTLGTPIDDTFSPNVDQITSFFEKYSKSFKKNQLFILRSTVSPGTTEYLVRFLRSRHKIIGKDIFLAYCPERIAEGKSIEELYQIPQIIGTLDTKSAGLAAKIFGRLTKKLLFTDSRSAELAKLYCNMYRYIDFAIGNEFMMIADNHERDIYEILRLVNQDYKRSGLKGPGFTAGPCLVKDGFFLLDKSPFLDLVAAAWRINENVPGFLVHKLKENHKLEGKKIAILGKAFKKNIDDSRYSLSLKLERYFISEGAHVAMHDPYLTGESLEKVIKNADFLVLAVNHDFYKSLSLKYLAKLVNKNCIICDIWNHFQTGEINFQLKDMLSEKVSKVKRGSKQIPGKN